MPDDALPTLPATTVLRVVRACLGNVADHCRTLLDHNPRRSPDPTLRAGREQTLRTTEARCRRVESLIGRKGLPDVAADVAGLLAALAMGHPCRDALASLLREDGREADARRVAGTQDPVELCEIVLGV